MAVRLVEMGPRIQLKLMKIQEGFCSGDIIYQHGLYIFPEIYFFN